MSIRYRFATARPALLALIAIALMWGCSSSENECAECQQEKCADLIQNCQDAASCACMIDCMGEEGIPGVSRCLGTCDLTERPVGFAAFEECVAVACPDSDECSTPDNYVAPPDTVTCEGSSAGIGSGSLADCSFDPNLVFDPEGTVLQLESADQSVCVRLERRNDGAGTLANTQWSLIDLRVGPLGEVALIEDAAAQCWYSSHHNFRDWIHAWTGTRHYDLMLAEDGHRGTRRYELYVFEQGPVDTASCAPSALGAQCIEGPIELLPVNGQ